MTVVPCSRARSARRPPTASVVRLSSRAVGSSAISTAGRPAIARASATRSRSPAESRSTARSAWSASPTIGERVHRPLARLEPVDLAERQRELDVLAGGEHPGEARHLADDADPIAAERRPLRPGRAPRARRRRRRPRPRRACRAPRAARGASTCPSPDGPVTTVSVPGREHAVEVLEGRLVPEAPRHAARLDERARGGQRRLVGTTGVGDGVAGVGRSSTASGRTRTSARSPIPAARSDSSGTRSQPPRPITIVSSPPVALLADPPVADVHDAVGDRRRGGIVADDERSGAFLARQRGEEVEDGPRACPRRAPPSARPRRAAPASARARRRARSAAARRPRARRARVRPVEELDPLEQLTRPACTLGRRDASEPERQRDQLLGGQVCRRARASSAGRRSR